MSADPLGFSEDWAALGMINPSQHRCYLEDFEKGKDKNSEHYRWRAFCDFLKSQPRLANELMWRLYRLGDSDPDHAMGGAIMAEIVNRSECPTDLLKEAIKNSGRKHLEKIAGKRLEARSHL